MSQRNDETAGFAMAMGLIGGVALLFFLMVFAIASFLAFVFTIISLCAWNKPLHLGEYVVTPDTARAFVYRGLAGAVIAPTFWLFCCLIFQMPFQGEYLHFVVLAGYVVGSIGIEALGEFDQARGPEITRPTVGKEVGASRALPAPPKEAFRYATWDDEEERRS